VYKEHGILYYYDFGFRKWLDDSLRLARNYIKKESDIQISMEYIVQEHRSFKHEIL
jgi:hypothetical protein